MCEFSVKIDNFDFFGPNLLKNGFRFSNVENLCWDKNRHPQDGTCANFQEKQTALTKLDQKWI